METNPKGGNSKPSLGTIVVGETLLYRVRKAHKIAGDPKAGYKPSIELAEFVENKARPVTAVAAMNTDDDRFAQAKPRHAFQPVDLQVAIGAGWLTKDQFDKLIPSKGVAADDQEEGKHFITVNQLNPKFEGKRLRVQILETTETNRKGVQPKINPKTNQTVLVGGKPVYVIAQVAFEGNHDSNFLASDNTKRLFGETVEKMEIKENVASENLNN